MILGCIADDFTGASDIAGILAAEKMRTTLITSASDIGAATADAGVLAMKTRSIPANEAVAQSLEALRLFREAGCRQIVFKYCSTFDSTPAGNIGPVAEALAAALGSRSTVVCPAFPANGRTVYMGHLFVGDVLLAESGMRHHPITPMSDSDLRRWLRMQVGSGVGHVPYPIVRDGAAAISACLDGQLGLVVVDALDDDDMRTIGKAVASAPLVTGGSAVAMGLPENFRSMGLIEDRSPSRPNAVGPAVVLAGSCSEATNRQVDRYRKTHPSMGINIERLMLEQPVYEECNAFLTDHSGDAPLIFSTATPQIVREQQERYPPGQVAEAIERCLASLGVAAVARGTRRIVVAGGETSGAVTGALRPGPLEVGPMIAPGVPALGNGVLAFALKSGNFGDDDFLETAVNALGRQS